MSDEPHPGDPYIDSRDVIATIEAIRQSVADEETDVDLDYLHELEELAEEASDYAADWEYGEQLIEDGYFKTYAMEFADEIGAVPAEYTWPSSCIDWDQAARVLQMDYTCVTFGGYTYWVR